MVIPANSKPLSKLVLTALLSSGLTIVICISYIILCTIALIYRSECTPLDTSGRNFFWSVIYTTYIQGSECGNSGTRNTVTTPDTVFILLLLTLITSVLCLIMAGILTAVVRNKSAVQYINMTVYSYIGFSIASLVVDLTLASHFGMDYMSLQSQLGNIGDGLMYAKYYGAFTLMTISMKGYVAHAINLVLLVLLVVYAVQNRNWLRDEHSIHKIGVLNAFESPRHNEDNWSQHPNYPPFIRSEQTSYGPTNNSRPIILQTSSSHINNGFITEEDRPRNSARDITRSDMSNRSFDRSDSWHHSRVMPDLAQGSRPFSYLEEIKRPVPVKPPASPTVEPQWRRDPWPPAAGPPLPAPDYSPQTPRRLKSALKSGYM